MTDESSNDIGHHDTIAEEQQFKKSDNSTVKKKWSIVNFGYTEFKVDDRHSSLYELLRTKEPNRRYNLRILIIFVFVLTFCVAASSVLTYHLTVHFMDMKSLCTNSSVDNNLAETTICSNDSRSYNIPKMALCPKDWEPYSNWCYQINTKKKTWYEAREDCQTKKADLLSVHNKNESNILHMIYGDFWIGLNDIDNEGMFVWTDGSKTDFLSWNTNEPTNGNGNEDCTHSYAKLETWNDAECSEKLSYVCKMQCGEGNWILIHDSCYLFSFPDKSLPPLSSSEANQRCRSIAADLVYIGSRIEFDIVRLITLQTNENVFWIRENVIENLKILQNQSCVYGCRKTNGYICEKKY